MTSKSDHVELTHRLRILVAAYPSMQISPDTIALYTAELAEYEMATVEKALRLAVRSYPYFPTLAKVLECIRHVDARYQPLLLGDAWWIAWRWAESGYGGDNPKERLAIEAAREIGLATHLEYGMVADRPHMAKRFEAVYKMIVAANPLTPKDYEPKAKQIPEQTGPDAERIAGLTANTARQIRGAE